MRQSFQKMKIVLVIGKINLLVVLRLGHGKGDTEGKKSREAMFIEEETRRRQSGGGRARDLPSREVTFMLT